MPQIKLVCSRSAEVAALEGCSRTGALTVRASAVLHSTCERPELFCTGREWESGAQWGLKDIGLFDAFWSPFCISMPEMISSFAHFHFVPLSTDEIQVASKKNRKPGFLCGLTRSHGGCADSGFLAFWDHYCITISMSTAVAPVA